MNTVAALARSKRVRRYFWWGAGLLAFYTVFGFLILPLIVRAVAVKQLTKQFERQASIRQVRLNPFVLSGTIRGLLIQDRDGEPFISWEEVYANFQLSSFFRKPWVFKEVRVVQPFARLQVNKDYSLNCSDLIKKFSAEVSTAKAPHKPLFLEVERFQISGARVAVADLTVRVPFHRVIGPIELSLTHFHTDPASKNPYAFSGTTDGGEQFSWNGYFFLDPIRSGGELSLNGLSLPKYAPLYQDFVRFDIRAGTISLQSEYVAALSASNFTATVTNAAFLLENLKVADRATSEDVIELDSLRVAGLSADVSSRSTEIGQVSVKGGRIVARRGSDETLNLLELSTPAARATNAPGGILFLLQAATNAFGAFLSTTSLWSATVHQLEVTNCALHWEDLALTRPVRLDLDEIAVDGRHLSNVPGSNQTAAVSMRWNTNGSIRMQSTVQIAPAAADFDLEVHDLEMRPLDPYLQPFVNAFILGSQISTEGRLSMRMGTNSLPEVGFRGGAQLNEFATVDGVMAEDLVKWKSLRLEGIDAKLLPPSVAVQEIVFEEPYARVAMETNRTLNLFTVLRFGDTNTVRQEAPVPSSAPAAPKKKEGMRQKLGSILRGILESSTNATGASVLPKITISTMTISNAAVRFEDRSVLPPVSASMQEVNGVLSGISSEELRRADLHLTGKVDRTGPFEVSGKLNPLSHNAPTELKVVFQAVELTPVSPYSGKYLGYRLNRGKLNLEVNYEISERQLKAKNLVVLDQFTLGEKVNSPDSTKLPVRLAVALLKDRNGKIELDVPIEGNLDDPQFHYGKVIMHVIGNIITKLVTSPFAALGALFGGKGEEVSYQDFTPGSVELQEANLEKLQTLLHGLEQRPGLQLEIQGAFDPDRDRQALQRQKLEQELHLMKWTSLRKSEQSRLKPDEVALLPEERAQYLEKAYAARVQTNALNSASGATTDGKSASQPVRSAAAKPAQLPGGTSAEKGATALLQDRPSPDAAVPAGQKENDILETITVTDDELRVLALERAHHVQSKILETGKLQPERLFLSEGEAASVTNTASRVYFHLR
jgi:hypothetical protein